MSSEKAKQIISQSQKIMVVGHVRPDADAISSALGMKNFINSEYPQIECTVYFSAEFTDSWDFIDPDHSICWVEDIAKDVSEFDTIVFVDAAQLHRFSPTLQSSDIKQVKTICVDHHDELPDEYDLIISEPKAASTAQLVYKYFYKGSEIKLTKSLSTALLLGIVGDTNAFNYVSHRNVEVLEIAKELIAVEGVQVQNLELNISRISERVFEICNVLSNNAEFVDRKDGYNYMYSFVNFDLLGEYSEGEINKATSKFHLDYVRKISGYTWGFIVYPLDGKFKISFRSMPGSVDVRHLASEFDGGGHSLSSGASMPRDAKLSAEDACDIVLKRVSEIDLELVPE